MTTSDLAVKHRLKQPTITIAGVELPRPEMVEPDIGKDCYIPTVSENGIGYGYFEWNSSEWRLTLLRKGLIHLAPENAKAWSDFWLGQIREAMK